MTSAVNVTAAMPSISPALSTDGFASSSTHVEFTPQRSVPLSRSVIWRHARTDQCLDHNTKGRDGRLIQGIVLLFQPPPRVYPISTGRLPSSMSESNDAHFVGAMPPQLFLDKFMQTSPGSATPPALDFSQSYIGNSVEDICRSFIDTVYRCGICPGIKFFQARTTRQRALTELPHLQPQPLYDLGGRRIKGDVPLKWVYPCPAMAARKQSRARLGPKKTRGPVEYYDFATALLDIEVAPCLEADPFVDPHESESYQASSSTSNTSPHQHLSAPSPAELSHSESPPPSQDRDKLHKLTASPRRRHSPVNISQLIHCIRPPPNSSMSPLRSIPVQPVNLHDKPHSASSGPSAHSEYYEAFENPSETASTFRAFLLQHAGAQWCRHFRAFSFTIILLNRHARFVRWDRSGAIVTERFDYVSDPRLLGEFLWRFAHMNDDERGFDPTATRASRAEVKLFRRSVQDFLDGMTAGTTDAPAVRKLPDAERTLDNSNTFPIWKLHIVDAASRQSAALIVNRPLFDRSTVFGRSTRAYLAYDLQQHRLVFLKDTWRPDHSKLQIESETYQVLSKHRIQHIPVVFYAGDVCHDDRSPQATLTQAFAANEDDWRVTDGYYEKYIHHRVVQDIYYPLESALDEREFLQVFADAVHALSEAYDVAGLLHRDVSVGNVMITSDGRGVLNDWDHAGSKDNRSRGVGTWRFMSIALLQDPDKIHELVDDLEAVFWVLVYAAFKRFLLPGDIPPMLVFDHEETRSDGRRVGGSFKKTCLFSRQLEGYELTSASVHKLVLQASIHWFKYHVNLTGAPWMKAALGPPEDSATYDLIGKPAFWVELFDSALNDYDTGVASRPCAQATLEAPHDERSELSASNSGDGHRSVVNARKRKTRDEAGDEHVPRRSKRLKARIGVQRD